MKRKNKIATNIHGVMKTSHLIFFFISFLFSFFFLETFPKHCAFIHFLFEYNGNIGHSKHNNYIWNKVVSFMPALIWVRCYFLLSMCLTRRLSFICANNHRHDQKIHFFVVIYINFFLVSMEIRLLGDLINSTYSHKLSTTSSLIVGSSSLHRPFTPRITIDSQPNECNLLSYRCITHKMNEQICFENAI